MECNICKHQTQEIFTTEVLHTHKVTYYQCTHCKFIQTEKPFWLAEAYQEAISSLDIGYLTRNIMYSEITESLIKEYFNHDEQFLDYGGGYGMFVRLMRDKGLHFYRQDLYCENLFAKYLDITDLDNTANMKFELLTAFEVFEHLEDPMAEIKAMFDLSNSILFSTEFQPAIKLSSPADWWYFVPETGQHIALFSKEALTEISKAFNCNLYSNGSTLHLLTKNSFKKDPVKLISEKHMRLDKKQKRNFSNPLSLIQYDFEQAKQKLLKKKAE